MDPNYVTALATIALVVANIMLVFFAGRTINEQRMERRLHTYERLSNLYDDFYITMVSISDVLYSRSVRRVILYYICDTARVESPTVNWDRSLNKFNTEENDQYEKLRGTEGSPKNIRKLYLEMFHLKTMVCALATKEVKNLQNDFFELTVTFMEDLRQKCAELIPKTEKTNSKIEKMIEDRFADQIIPRKLGPQVSIDLTEKTEEFNSKRRELQRQIENEMNNSRKYLCHSGKYTNNSRQLQGILFACLLSVSLGFFILAITEEGESPQPYLETIKAFPFGPVFLPAILVIASLLPMGIYFRIHGNVEISILSCLTVVVLGFFPFFLHHFIATILLCLHGRQYIDNLIWVIVYGGVLFVLLILRKRKFLQ